MKLVEICMNKLHKSKKQNITIQLICDQWGNTDRPLFLNN